VLLLGGGRIQQAPRDLFGTNILWTGPDDSGLRVAAVQLGYGGPTNMSFLRLTVVTLAAEQPPVQELDGINYGLNLAAPEQIRALAAISPIG
jgi:hypothetical protein